MRIMSAKILDYILKNKIMIGIILIYSLMIIGIINWGIPNQNHPYNYHMDEWHQLQSIKALYKYGSPNVGGAANGTIFQFLLSGIYLVPFVFLKIIDPSLLKSGVGSLLMQERLFEILRLNTLIFGILSLITLSHLVKKYFKVNSALTLIFFSTTPLWLALSNYFKYDIALTFWIITSLFYLLRYGADVSLKNYVIAGIFCSLALATKISALPLVVVYIFSFFYFNYGKKKDYWHILAGLFVFALVFAVFGIPDLFLQRGDYREYLYSNLIRDPIIFNNFMLNYKVWWMQVLLRIVPLDFGYVFSGISLLSIAYWSIRLIPRIIKQKFDSFRNEIFIFISMIIFILSLIPLELGANGNRLLVLLPFFAIFSSIFILRILRQFASHKNKIYVFLAILFAFQFMQSFALIYIKWQPDPRETSSHWMTSNISKGSVLGIENIPIYQLLPDLVVKEFYVKNKTNMFKYEIIDNKSVDLPDTIVMTNREFDLNYLKSSPKKALLMRLNREGYRAIVEFKPNKLLYEIMGNEFDFYSSGIVPISTITMYKRDKNPQN